MSELPASEWSKLFSGDPPAALRSLVDTVTEMVLGLAPTVDGPNKIAVPDRPRVVSIFGGRGTGKSTVLRLVMDQLDQRAECLVLPVIDPEGFARGDSLGGWVLAHLRKTLGEADLSYDVSEAATLGTHLGQLGRRLAVHSSGFLPGLESRGLTFEDFGRDAVKVPAHGVDLGGEWAALMDHVATARGAPRLQLVIPIDDADLAPELLPDIVVDAQFLGASPRTTVVFAADLSTVKQALALAAVSSYGQAGAAALTTGLMPLDDIHDLVGRRLVKNFPRSLRVRLRGLSVPERLAFRPLGAEDSILEVLTRFHISRVGYSNLGEMFTVRSSAGEQIGVLDHGHCLSDNQRDLRQLHEELDNLRPDDPNAARRAVAVLLRQGIDAVANSPVKAGDAIEMLGDDDTGATIAFDLSDLTFGKTTSGSMLIYSHSGDGEDAPILATQVVMRLIVQHYASPRNAQSGDAANTDRVPEVPRQLSHLYYFAWECAQDEGGGERPLAMAEGMVGSPSLPGGGSWSNQITPTYSDRESWSYFTVPEWDAFSDYFTYSHGWHCLHTAISRLGMAPPSYGTYELVEFLVLTHLRLVCMVQQCRRVPNDVVALNAETLRAEIAPDTWPERRKVLVEDVLRELAVTLDAGDETPISRSRDFRIWFDGYLPLVVSPLFCTAAISEPVLDLWKEKVSPDARGYASRLIADSAGSHINVSTADADVLLLEQIGEKDRAEQLRAVRRQFVLESETRQAAILEQLRQRGTPGEMLDAIKTQGSSSATLVSLIAGGIPRELIAQVAELFPPPSAPQDEPGRPDGSDG